MSGLVREVKTRKRTEILSGVRTCTCCHHTLPLADFYRKNDKPFYHAVCKSCFKTQYSDKGKERRYRRDMWEEYYSAVMA
jgi:hypothetical protein